MKQARNPFSFSRMIEAITCGVPPVSFACPSGPKDIITDGYDGLLLKKGDIEMLAGKSASWSGMKN